mmetsp:Transcript_71368/g.134874  ORF Transcript_71368/g.134874 Transcript_71368/m.134874 type:complete len:325 (-) Transcript_71368:43-1017(-)
MEQFFNTHNFAVPDILVKLEIGPFVCGCATESFLHDLNLEYISVSASQSAPERGAGERTPAKLSEVDDHELSTNPEESLLSDLTSEPDASSDHESAHSNGLFEALPHADWWGDADVIAMRGLEELPQVSRLVNVELVHSQPVSSCKSQPWEEGESLELYERMRGIDAQGEEHVAWWMNVGDSSLVMMSKVLDPVRLHQCFFSDSDTRSVSEECLATRLKLIISPVQVQLPFPSKGPHNAETLGAFFGEGASCTLTRSRDAHKGDFIVVQIDLYSKWLLRKAMQSLGFRKGNVLDLILVDWPGQAVIASSRLSVTDEFLKRQASK